MEYLITSSVGVVMGTYSGESPEQAWEAMCQDAGYSRPFPEEECGQASDWHIEEVTDDRR